MNKDSRGNWKTQIFFFAFNDIREPSPFEGKFSRPTINVQIKLEAFQYDDKK